MGRTRAAKRLRRLLHGAFRSRAYPSQEPERVVEDHLTNLRALLKKKDAFTKHELEQTLQDAEAQLKEADEHLDLGNPRTREQRAFVDRLLDTLKTHVKSLGGQGAGGGGAPPRAERPGAEAARIRLRASPEGGLDALRESLRGVFQDGRNAEWLREVNRVWGDLPSAVAGRNAMDLDVGVLQTAASELEAESRRLRSDASRATPNSREATLLEKHANDAALASDYLRLLHGEVNAKKARVLHAEATRLRKDLQKETSGVYEHLERLQAAPTLDEPTLRDLEREVQRLGNQEAKYAQRKRRLAAIEKEMGLRNEQAWPEINKRLAQIEDAKRQLKSLRERHARQAQKAREEHERQATARKTRSGEVVQDYDHLYQGWEQAQRVLRDPFASQEAREDARAFLGRYKENLKRLAKRGVLEGSLREKERQIERWKQALEGTTGPDRERLKTLIRTAQERVASKRAVLARARASPTDDLPPGEVEWWRSLGRGTRVGARRVGAWIERGAEHAREPLRLVRKNKAFQAVTEGAAESGRVAAYGWLWRTQAKRYRRQEEAAREAQRRAGSSMWNWWYTFSTPVRRTIAWSMALAPVMVPLGIVQIAGWMVLVVAAYILNGIGSALLELWSLGTYAFLGLINVGGSLIKGFLDSLAHNLLGKIGQCDTPDSACAYQSLDFHFGVHYPQAGPLLDPRLFFPTHFSNNSILSVTLDFLATINPWVVVLAGAGAILVWPVLLMEDAEPWKRILIALLLAVLVVPAFLTQGFLQESFYRVAADLFRTGVGNVFTEPAAAFARQARDAVQDAMFNPLGGG